MKYDLKMVYLKQKELDDRINEIHKLDYEETINDRLLALIVEIAEFANETRTFKYWSTKPAHPRVKILEEYVDVMHFAISFGIHFGASFDEGLFVKELNPHLNLTDYLLELFKLALNLKNNRSLDNYKEFMAYYLGISVYLEYTYFEVVEAYLKKNQTNHERQDNKY
jgi:dimeric dUTPase (all-alpha-NTP-PPase superfamily)